MSRRRPAGRSLRARLDSIEQRHRDLGDRPDLAADHAAFVVYFWLGLRPAECSERTWRAAYTRAETVRALAATVPHSPEPDAESPDGYAGARADRIVSATLSVAQRRTLAKLSPAKLWARWHRFRLDLLASINDRAQAIAETDPELLETPSGKVHLLNRTLRELEAEAGLPEWHGGFADSRQIVPPLRLPAVTPEPPRWPAGFQP